MSSCRSIMKGLAMVVSAGVVGAFVGGVCVGEACQASHEKFSDECSDRSLTAAGIGGGVGSIGLILVYFGFRFYKAYCSNVQAQVVVAPNNDLQARLLEEGQVVEGAVRVAPPPVAQAEGVFSGQSFRLGGT